MKPSRKLLFDISAGLTLSTIFCVLLVRQILAGGVGAEMSLAEFFSVPDNSIFCLLMSSFIFASWLMRGINNRMVLFCWAIGAILHQVIFWTIYHWFYYESLNIYILNLAGVAGTLPIVLFLKYRVTYSCWLFEQFWKLRLFRRQIEHYLSNAKVTDFECRMKRALYLGFLIELLYSGYLNLYAIRYQLPYNGSIYNHLSLHNHWDPLFLYSNLTSFMGCVYIFILCFYLVRDSIEEDSFLFGFSNQDKRAVAEKILEEVREKSKNNKPKN